MTRAEFIALMGTGAFMTATGMGANWVIDQAKEAMRPKAISVGPTKPNPTLDQPWTKFGSLGSADVLLGTSRLAHSENTFKAQLNAQTVPMVYGSAFGSGSSAGGSNEHGLEIGYLTTPVQTVSDRRTGAFSVVDSGCIAARIWGTIEREQDLANAGLCEVAVLTEGGTSGLDSSPIKHIAEETNPRILVPLTVFQPLVKGLPGSLTVEASVAQMPYADTDKGNEAFFDSLARSASEIDWGDVFFQLAIGTAENAAMFAFFRAINTRNARTTQESVAAIKQSKAQGTLAEQNKQTRSLLEKIGITRDGDKRVRVWTSISETNQQGATFIHTGDNSRIYIGNGININNIRQLGLPGASVVASGTGDAIFWTNRTITPFNGPVGEGARINIRSTPVSAIKAGETASQRTDSRSWSTRYSYAPPMEPPIQTKPTKDISQLGRPTSIGLDQHGINVRSIGERRGEPIANSGANQTFQEMRRPATPLEEHNDGTRGGDNIQSPSSANARTNRVTMPLSQALGEHKDPNAITFIPNVTPSKN